MIVGEALSRMMLVAGEANLINGFMPASNASKVTHLQYADDTIIFCVVEEEQVKNVVAVLKCFKAVFGLKVNFHKSAIFVILVEDQLLHHFAKLLGCKVGSFPTFYLGLPL